MKHSEVSFLFALVTAAGCVELDEPEVASVEEAIVDGVAQSPQAQAVALISSTCSATMISNDLALTTGACGAVGATAVIGASSSKVRNVRVPRRSTGNDAPVVAIQLHKPLGLSSRNGVTTTGFSRTVDKTPLKQGEAVVCFGYSNKSLKSGVFDVIDGSTDRLYKLRGRTNPVTGNPSLVSTQDLGGFCQRDGGGIAAILSSESGLGDIAQALPVHDLAGGLVDMQIAKEASAVSGAVRFRDDKQQRFLTAVPDATNVVAAGASSDPGQRDQAFYLDRIANPPASGDWYRLVDARSGRCLTTVNAAVLTQRSCTTNLDQMFFVQYKEVNGLGRYLIGTQGGLVDAAGTPSVTLVPSSNGTWLTSQQFEMWLTPL